MMKALELAGQYGENSESSIRRIRFNIRDFEKREEQNGQYFETGSIKAHGVSWRLRVFPRGDANADSEIYFIISHNGNIEEELIYLVYHVGGNNPPFFSQRIFDKLTRYQHYEEEFSRDQLLNEEFSRDILLHKVNEHGTLIIDVDIEILDKNVPKYRLSKKITRSPDDICFRTDLYKSVDETSDVSFVVGNPLTHNVRVIKAHKCILAIRLRVLYEMVPSHDDDSDENKSKKIVLSDVDPTLFEIMLKFTYTEIAPRIFTIHKAKSILMFADRFGCTELKIYCESILTHNLDESNASELLVFADCHSCALLKEGAMEEYMMNPSAVMKGGDMGDEKVSASEIEEDKDEEVETNICSTTNYWSQILESPKLLSELLQYTSIDYKKQRYEPPLSGPIPHINFDHLDVTSVREWLRSYGSSIDGSREVLINRLKEHTTSNDNESE